MRFTIASFVLVTVVASALAGPVAKVTEKKSLIGNTKLEKEAPKIEEIGDQKDRSKKSTTTFCVEIRPGTNEAVQKSCACKDKEGHSDGQQAPQPVPQSAPQQQAPQLSPASAPPSVNIIHAPPQQPQTLNIIQPAPTLHALHFVQPQSGPSAVQNLHFLQPAARLPEPIPQTHHYAPSSKPATEESIPSKSVDAEIIVKPSESAPKPAIQPEAHLAPQPALQPALQPVVQPAAQPAPQSQHTEQSHKSEVHVSVVTADKKEEETKPHFENIVQPAQKPVETIKIVPLAPVPRPYEEQILVVPNSMMMHQPEPCQHSGAIIQVPQMSPGSLYQPQGALYQPQGALYQPQGALYQPQGAIYPQGSVYQMPSSMYQQGGGPVYTECSCKQMHPASSNVHSMIVPSHVKPQGRHAKITPLVIYPPAAPSMPVQGEKSAVSVHCNPESATSVSSHSNDSPVIVNMQTARSKDGMEQGEAEDMTQSNMSERTVSHISLDTPSSYYHGHIHHAPKVYYDVSPGVQANLYKEPSMKPYYGGHHQVHMEISRQAQPALDGSKQEENKDMKLDSMPPGTRITRSDKEATTKVEDKVAEEKKVEEKTSSAKAA